MNANLDDNQEFSWAAFGEAAVLIEVRDDTRRHQFARRLPAPDLGIQEVVTGAQSLLIRFDAHRIDASRAVAWLLSADEATAEPPTNLLEIPVRYDGPDLHTVAEAAGVDVDEVITAHLRATYVAEFCGFSPGFAYLSGLNLGLHLPRRRDPRTQVPAGAVAIADRYTAIYPRSSPGGWHLIGSTTAPLFDVMRSAPALIRPGDRVRFVVASSRHR